MKRILIIWALLISVCFAQSKAGFYVVGGKIITVQDTSSRKYLKAIEGAGVVPSVTQNFASNYLVTTERAIGSYSIMVAQYPFIGGTAATHKFNQVNPIDNNSGYRLTFTGATHSANGVQFNGTTGFGNTYVIPSVSLGSSSTHLSIYSNTNNSSGNSVDIGTGIVGTYLNMYTRFTGNVTGGRIFGNPLTYSNTSENGYYLMTTTAANLIRFYKNGVKFSPDNTSGGTSTITTAIFIGANNTDVSPGSAGFFSNEPYQLITIGGGLTEPQVISQTKIATFFNSLLGRQ